MTPVKQAPASAVVFAYHDIGVRCLEALLELGVEVRLVVTHLDSESEQIWFESVSEHAKRNGIPVITPGSPNAQAVIQQVEAYAPDFIFSFYYRQMLSAELLAVPAIGAFNLHGSLLPKYRGRVPVNWAIIHGEEFCGVSLHQMVSKPDAGDLFAQKAVPILSNDTAFDVFQKLKCVAELLLTVVVPGLMSRQLTGETMDLDSGSYFGGRKPEDGLINWEWSAHDIHNLIRAVAPPFPGAFFEMGGHRVDILLSHIRGEKSCFAEPCIYLEDGQFYADCTDGYRFMIVEMNIDGQKADQVMFRRVFGSRLRLNPANKP